MPVMGSLLMFGVHFRASTLFREDWPRFRDDYVQHGLVSFFRGSQRVLFPGHFIGHVHEGICKVENAVPPDAVIVDYVADVAGGVGQVFF